MSATDDGAELSVSRVANVGIVSDAPNGAGPSDSPTCCGSSGQSRPSTQSSNDTFTLFNLNSQGIETDAKRPKFYL